MRAMDVRDPTQPDVTPRRPDSLRSIEDGAELLGPSSSVANQRSGRVASRKPRTRRGPGKPEVSRI